MGEGEDGFGRGEREDGLAAGHDQPFEVAAVLPVRVVGIPVPGLAPGSEGRAEGSVQGQAVAQGVRSCLLAETVEIVDGNLQRRRAANHRPPGPPRLATQTRKLHDRGNADPFPGAGSGLKSSPPAFRGRCSCYAFLMTLHQPSEVGVRELHDRLSEFLGRVEGGGEIVITRRGRPVARLSGLGERPLDSLAQRGLVRMPQGRRSPRSARVKGTGPVSDLVSEQRI